MNQRLLASAVLALCASPAFALNIVVSNDDGLSSNLKALYDELKAAGHSVIVSVPCSAQSGRGSAIVMYSTTIIIADNDKTQIDAEGGCHNGAAPVGAPAVGTFTKTGYTNGDFNYVHGTPVMATLYGLDVLAKSRWGKAPDLLISGPNEGQNAGTIVLNSGTVSNVQFAAARGVPAIALSAGFNTIDNTGLASPKSRTVARLALTLISTLQTKSGNAALLPPGVALNVNFPNAVEANTGWAFARQGSYEFAKQEFNTAAPWGLRVSLTGDATPEQAEDEANVFKTKIAVTSMQVAYEQRPAGQQWLRLRLRELFAQ
jgi:5'/3'-nucleotidase SurE